MSNELDRDRVLFWTSLVRLPVPWWGRPAGQDAWLAAVQLCWEREEGVAVWLVKRLQRERVSFNLGSTYLHRLPLQYLFGENNFEYLISSSSREWWKKTICWLFVLDVSKFLMWSGDGVDTREWICASKLLLVHWFCMHQERRKHRNLNVTSEISPTKTTCMHTWL